MDRKWLGDTIKALRKAKEWSQKDLERFSGVSERSIQEIEGARANPGLGAIESIEGALGVTLIIANDAQADQARIERLTAEITALREQNKSLHDGNALLAKLLNLPLEIQVFVRAVVEKNPQPKGLPDSLGKVLRGLVSLL